MKRIESIKKYKNIIILIGLLLTLSGVFGCGAKEAVDAAANVANDVNAVVNNVIDLLPSETSTESEKETVIAEQQLDESLKENGNYSSSFGESEITYSFRKKSNLIQHFEKHGNEFPYATAEDYLIGANKVIQNPDALTKTEKEDGDYVFYVESTNEFVVLSTDGYIRTYFKPAAGIEYYNRQ